MRKALAILFWACAGLAAADDDPAVTKMRQDCPGYGQWMDAQMATYAALETAEPKTYTEPALRKQLKAMVNADQAARMAAIGFEAQPESKAARTAWKKVAAIDRRNLPKIKAIIARHGFPTVVMIGRDGIGALWLLVQHADADPDFQEAVLKLLDAPMQAGEVQRGDVALLTDRVLVARGKPQRYGSQFHSEPGQPGRPQATEDYAHIDERRAAMDLPPMAVYACSMKSMYGGEFSTEPLAEPLKPRSAP